MHKGYKYRIYPNKEQQAFIRNCCDAARFVYNYALGNTQRLKEAADEVLKEYIDGLTMSDEDRELAGKMLKANAKDMKKLAKQFSDAELGTQLYDKIKSDRYYYNKYEFSKEIRRLDQVLNEDGEYRYPFLCKGRIDKGLINYALDDLQFAFDNIAKTGSGYPKFKKRYKSSLSYTTQKVGNNIHIVDDKFIKLPGMTPIKMVYHRPIGGEIKTATISITKSDQFYVSLCCDCPDVILENAGGQVGIDVGIKTFYSDSNGHSVENPKYYQKAAKRLKRADRKLSKMQEANILKRDAKGRPIYKRPLSECKNYQKQKKKRAKLYEKIANQRAYFQHVESKKLAEENSVVCMEDLRIKNMQKNKHLSKAIGDAGWYSFKTKVAYKMKEHGGELIGVPTFYPSSQLCSNCGYKNPIVRDLKVRDWTCPKCGTHLDRDINAGQNILKKGLESLKPSET